MPVQLRGNYVFVNPGEPCFLVSSNYTNYLELGRIDSNDFFLIARIEEKQHLIDAALFDEQGRALCMVLRNHLDAIYQGDWLVKTRVDGGFSIVKSSGETLMNVKLDEKGVCLIEGKFYNRNGECVAIGDGKDFLIFKGPAVLGRSGLARGIVIG